MAAPYVGCGARVPSQRGSDNAKPDAAGRRRRFAFRVMIISHDQEE
jgi:hypothetical protein